MASNKYPIIFKGPSPIEQHRADNNDEVHALTRICK